MPSKMPEHGVPALLDRSRAGPIAADDGPQTDRSFEPDPAGYTALFSVLDRAWHASIARYTLGLSPRAIGSAYLDWLGGLAFSPGKQAGLVHKAQRKWMRFAGYAQSALANPSDEVRPCIEPLAQDRRFSDPAWRKAPFNLIYQGFLLSQQWWHNATTGVSGVTPADERAIEFAARQWLDIFSPSNFLLTNPVALNATIEEGGANLMRGAEHWIEDVRALIAGRGSQDRDAFAVGREVAATPGKVVYRNRLIELIQYAPTTGEVRAEPILITPAWIMKYYILDLSPHNSLVKYLVDRGHTVFIISWKNPDENDRDLSLDDYRRLGPMAALDAVCRITGAPKVHGVGYCLGGTLLAIAAAAMAREGDDRFATLTFLAAQVDFEEAGELMLFINEKQIAFLDDLMWEQGFLDSAQMAGAFQLLRSNDLIWSRVVNDYLMGRRQPMTDMMAWNADGTRMPYRMHAEYLRQLFLHNALAEGRYEVDGDHVVLADIRAPIFAVGAQTDHIAPWRSVYRWHLLTDGDLTFVLTNGGHNAGIVADPADTWRAYQITTRKAGQHAPEPARWAEAAPAKAGSWWPAWVAWLDGRSSADLIAPPPLRANGQPPLADAPGAYVHMT
jgi:polyhydroxyalkanoate synthase